MVPGCPKYELGRLQNRIGNCDVIGYNASGLDTEETCLERCLDLPNCRSISYDVLNPSCILHNCTENVGRGNSTFVKRTCLDQNGMYNICFCFIEYQCQNVIDLCCNFTIYTYTNGIWQKTYTE